jgi:4-amino-4-deoxy-L-arabinose transferase-like glycosyltransferase
MDSRFFKYTNKFWVVFLLIVLIASRGIINCLLPLMDKTEARYAEIARIMVETNNWIVLHIDYDIPFWAKPPLSTWLSAISIKVFGLHEFYIRLPYLITTIIIVLFISRYDKIENKIFFLTPLILLLMPEFYLHAGVVSTDTILNFSIILVMLSFWEAIGKESGSKWWYGFFIGIGMGLLSKGPIILILTIPPIFVWLFVYKEELKKLKKIPILSGLFLTFLISCPWYYLKELKSPGFIDYFIYGEHFRRFFDSGWKGDLYGFAKQQPFGIIWLFSIISIFPWSFLIITRFKTIIKEAFKNKWVCFLVCWMLFTPVFFTFSSSLIHTYTLPIAVPASLLITNFWSDLRFKRYYLLISIVLYLSILPVFYSGMLDETIQNNCDKELVENYIVSDYSLFYLNYKSFSSQFYSSGSIKNISLNQLKKKIKNEEKFAVIIENSELKKVDLSVIKQLKEIRKTRKKNLYISDF